MAVGDPGLPSTGVRTDEARRRVSDARSGPFASPIPAQDDVTHRDVWYSEDLKADLDLTPMNFELMLYNLSDVRHLRLWLELNHYDLSQVFGL
jgi:hypothetical protein